MLLSNNGHVRAFTTQTYQPLQCKKLTLHAGNSGTSTVSIVAGPSCAVHTIAPYSVVRSCNSSKCRSASASVVHACLWHVTNASTA
eukprot:12228-Heterococcus_DN1.PRE.2